MQLIDISRLGAREISPGIVDFGVLLPGISSKGGFELIVRIIHANDQFLQKIPPRDFKMDHAIDPAYGDYWHGRVPINPNDTRGELSSWGLPGKYVYRYFLKNAKKKFELDWIIDPFAREFGTGKLSAITLGYKPHHWSDAEKSWKVPAPGDLVVYELMISEFGGNIDEAIHRLDYLADLGINCIEVMPVSNVDNVIDWGYLPIGHFGVDERFGKRKHFQRFVDEAHRRGIAVIVDSVYGHTSGLFCYAYVYGKLPEIKNPFNGVFVEKRYGECTNFHNRLTQDFFFTVSLFWLDRFHIDGFRYDCVPEYYDGPVGKGYANLAWSVRNEVRKNRALGGYWSRFFNGDECNLIQCAEHLDNPKEALYKTCSNCAWQDATMHAASGVATGHPDQITPFALMLGLSDFPSEGTCDGKMITKIPFQYIGNHDHSRFISNFGTVEDDNELLREGRRDLWYKVQPYLIGLFTGRGIPFLWQGEEFCENYCIPDDGRGRVLLFRPMRWDYFYDPYGKPLVDLVRKLAALRKNEPRFRHGDHYFYNHWDNYQSGNVMLFSRSDRAAFSLVALNFGDNDVTVPFAFPYSGDYREELYEEHSLDRIVAGTPVRITVPKNYGRIWTTAVR